jgi:hypothetical protein
MVWNCLVAVFLFECWLLVYWDLICHFMVYPWFGILISGRLQLFDGFSFQSSQFNGSLSATLLGFWIPGLLYSLDTNWRSLDLLSLPWFGGHRVIFSSPTWIIRSALHQTIQCVSIYWPSFHLHFRFPYLPFGTIQLVLRAQFWCCLNLQISIVFTGFP